MKTLLIYDNLGRILLRQEGNYILPEGGIQYIEIQIPSGKYPISIDMNTHLPIYEDLPKNEMEKLRDEIEQLKNDMADLMFEVVSGGI